MASEERERVVADLWALPATHGLTLEEWRHGAAAGERLPLPERFRFEAVDAGGVPAQWAWWDGTPGDGPVILFFHGGGWVVCSIGTHRVLGGRLAGEVGGRTLVVGYRLAPEHPFPIPVQDCVAAYRWLLDQGIDRRRIVFAGDSAGGNLVVAVALALKVEGVPLPAALVAVSPAPDLTFRGASNVTNRPCDPFSRIDDMDRIVDCYLRGHDPTDPLASPVFGDLAGLPPLLVMVGPQETLRDDSEELAKVAAAAGVDTTFELVDGAFHTWLNHGGVVPEADRSIARIGRFVSEHARR
jgi:monoterpene epsilon-lactone hydrolase